MISNQIAEALILVPGPSFVIFSLSRIYGRGMDRGAWGIIWAIVSSLSASVLGLFATLFLGSAGFLVINGVVSPKLSLAITVDALSYLYQVAWPLPFFIATWLVGLFFGARSRDIDSGPAEDANP